MTTTHQPESTVRDGQAEVFNETELTGEEIEACWKENWEHLLFKDGKIDLAQLKRELADISFVASQVPEVYGHITGGRLSKIMYYAQTVTDEVDNYIERQRQEAIEDYKQELIAAGVLLPDVEGVGE